MMGKIVTFGAMGVGYVLGARAGRERYEQIRAQAERLWSNPKVQRTVSQAGDTAKEKAPLLKEKSAEAAHKATDKVSDAVRSSGDGESATVDPVTGFRSP
ncbi:YtxH domain-containing protein [Arthrobacter monumenti]